MNIHNEVASCVFNCNTNVVAGVDGGSIMYITCYVSKNTNQEDSETYVKAGRRMIGKLRELYDAEEEDELQVCRKGVHTLLGSVLLTTKAHVVSAPMASYLVRNESRFDYSDQFQYINIKSFAKGCADDFILTGDYNGSAFLKSLVSNYLCRPQNMLKDLCVYDFFSFYSTSRNLKKNKKNKKVINLGKSIHLVTILC